MHSIHSLESPSTLRIGDYISIRLPKPNEGFLCAEGIINDDCFVSKYTDYFEDCLWEIHVQYQYNALREYEYAVEEFGEIGGLQVDEEETSAITKIAKKNLRKEEQELIAQLKKAAVNEKRLNEKLMTMKKGKPVAFGDVIQLQHVKSKTFMTVSMMVLAKQERENMRVGLEKQGSSECCLIFSPKFKHDREGQPISNNSELLIRAQERPSEYIHCSKKTIRGKGDDRREVNCSLETVSWMVNVYQHANDVNGKSVLAGHLVLLQEPETLACLMIDGQYVEGDKAARVVLSAPLQLSNSSFASVVGTQYLWSIECVESMKGGPLQIRTDKIVFRALNAGFFMQLTDTGLFAVKDRKHASHFEVTYSQHCEFSTLVEGITVQLLAHGKFVTTAKPSANASADQVELGFKLCAGDTDRNSGLCLVVNADLFHTVGVDMHVGVDATAHIKKFSRAMLNGNLMRDPNLPVETIFKSFFKTLEACCAFLVVDSNHSDSLEHDETSDIFQRTSVEIIKMRQTMMREQGFVDAILDILDHCLSGHLDNVKLDARRAANATSAQMKRERKSMVLAHGHSHRYGHGHGHGHGHGYGHGHGHGHSSRVTNVAGAAVAENSSRASRRTAHLGPVGGSRSSIAGVAGKVSPSPNGGRRSIVSMNSGSGRNLTNASSAKFVPGDSINRTMSGGGDDDDGEDEDEFDNAAMTMGVTGNAGPEEEKQNTAAQDVAHFCLKTLLGLMKNNHANQCYVADRFPLLLRHARVQPLAVACVQSMLHDNIEVLHTKVREREINMLVQLLVDSDMDVIYLKLIQSTCSMGFDNTQGFVTEALFGLGEEATEDAPDPGRGGTGVSPAKIKMSNDGKDELVTGMVGFPQLGGAPVAFSKKPYAAPNENEHSHTPKVNVRRSSQMQKLHAHKSSTAAGHLQILRAGALNAIVASKKLNDMHLHHGSLVSVHAGESETKIIQHTNLVMSVQAEREDLQEVLWSKESKYIPHFEEIMLRQMYGYGLLIDGVPKLYAKWTHGGRTGNFSMLNVFGVEDRVPFELIYGQDEPLSIVVDEKDKDKEGVAGSLAKSPKQASSRRLMGPGSKSKGAKYAPAAAGVYKMPTKQTLERKMQVANYLVAQLYLVADLCLNRQYVAMGVLENLYEYDVLIAMMQAPDMPNKFKAPVCRVLRCLYVDREPQVEAKFPRLIRTSVSLGGGEENSFSDHHSGSPYAFALLQELISIYVHTGLNSKKCDVLSGEMMDLLHALMMFGFYYTPQHLQDTIVPLIKALDNHREIGLSIARQISTANRRKNHHLARDGENEDNDEDQVDDEDRLSDETLFLFDMVDSFFDSELGQTIHQKSTYVGDLILDFWDHRIMRFRAIHPENSEKSAHRGPKQSSLLYADKSKKRSNNFPETVAGGSAGLLQKSYDSVESNPTDSKQKELTPEEEEDWNRRVFKRTDKYVFWRVKKVTDSIYYIACIIVVVLFAVITSMLQLFDSDVSAKDLKVLNTVDICASVFFIVELLLRLFTHVMIYEKVYTFWYDGFNFLDTIVVLLDIIVLSLGLDPNLVRAASIVRTLRVIRATRLIRVLRAAKLVKRMNTVEVSQWVFPSRYKHASTHEVKTISAILRILAIAMDRIQDQRLGTVIKAFVEYIAEDKQGANNNAKAQRSAVEVYQKVAAGEFNMSADIPPDFDQMLIDVMMHNDSSMVQEALQLLMIHKSADRLLCEAMGKVQIIYSPRVEQKCKEIISMLRDLKRMGDMYEIWGSLETPEDKATAEDMASILHRMEELIVLVVDPKTATADELNLQVDAEVQQLLLNLDAMSTFMTLQNSLYDGGNESEPQIKKLWAQVNDIICLYVYKCPANQEIAFQNIAWFVARVDDEVDSSKVVRAIVSGNRDLIKSLPRHFIGDFAKMILSNGRKPEYLDLFVGVVEPVDDVVVKVKVIQNEIVKYLTSREWKEHLVLWCDSAGSVENQKRKEAMMQCSSEHGADCDEADLTPDLQYHVNYLTLLANCNLGPKLLAMYGLEDVLSGIIDAGTIFPVRKALANVFLEMVSGDVSIPGVEISHLVWQFFEMVTLFFEISENDLSKLFRTTSKLRPKTQRVEWLSICLKIVDCFFENFEMSTFNEMISRDDDFNIQITSKTEEDVVELLTRLYSAVLHTRDRHGFLLGENMRINFANAIESLAELLPDIPSEEQEHVSFVPHDKSASSRRQRDSVTIADIQQVVFREQFYEFAQKLTGNAQQLYASGIELFENIPLTTDMAESDVRLEPLIRKLCTHIRAMIVRKGVASRSLDHEVMDTVTWLIKTWRLLLEKYIGVEMEYYCRTDGVDVVVNEKARKYQQLLNTCGVTYLCLELISVGIDHLVVIESIYLLVALLMGKKGNDVVQVKVAKYLCDTDSTLFFQEVGELIEQLTLWSSREFEGRNDDRAVYELPDEIGVFKLLQLLCLGNFAPCQNCIRDQFGNTRVVGLIGQLATYSDVLSRLESHLCTQMCIHLVQTIHTLIQGPCKGNQDQFVLQTELLLSLNRIIRDIKPQFGCSIEWYYHIERLKECSVDVLRASIEDQPPNSVILERVATSIELGVLHVLILPKDSSSDRLIDREDMEMTPLQAKYLVFRHSLREQTKLSGFSLPVQTVYQSGISCVEVVWNNEVHRHYFHIPDIANDLSAMSIDMLYAAMDSPTHEMQLREFLQQARHMYIEATNQRVLRQIGIGNIARWKNRLLRVMYWNACIMNFIMVAYYVKRTISDDDGHGVDDHAVDDHAVDDGHRRLAGAAAAPVYPEAENFMAEAPMDALVILNVVQCIFSFATLLIYALVRVPTTYRAHIESGKNYLNVLLGTICDPIPLWYLVYFVLAMLGLLYNPLFLAALMLDFVVQDSTTKDVMTAVTQPWRQILSTMALIAICSYIFAVVIFQLFWDEVVTFQDTTLWDTVKVAITYGIRGEYGIGHEMTPTIHARVIMDVIQWVIVLEILRSVFHAIIIDGFANIREVKMER